MIKPKGGQGWKRRQGRALRKPRSRLASPSILWMQGMGTSRQRRAFKKRVQSLAAQKSTSAQSAKPGKWTSTVSAQSSAIWSWIGVVAALSVLPAIVVIKLLR